MQKLATVSGQRAVKANLLRSHPAQAALAHRDGGFYHWRMALIIDPRASELIGHDLHLPPVSPDRFSRHALSARFASPPSWQPDVEVEKWYRAPDPVQAPSWCRW